ncbi:MAG: DUF502 domain-containing protein [Rubellimicrobium sp.]|nr:DUF502 domain-containing protein [Rubellimicrobium sp.]
MPPGRVFAWLRNNFLTGVVVIAPITLTFWLLWSIAGWVDGFVLPFIPSDYRPEAVLGRLFAPDDGTPASVNVRGLGIIVFLAFTITVGWIAKGIVGRSFIRWGEDIVSRLPVIRPIYNALKQISETVFSQRETSFQKGCLVEYPKEGSWAVGFISTNVKGEVLQRIAGGTGEEFVSVFMPSTPNPTTGFLMFVPRSKVHELDMTIEDCAKLVISAGLVYPPNTVPQAGLPPPETETLPDSAAAGGG